MWMFCYTYTRYTYTQPLDLNKVFWLLYMSYNSTTVTLGMVLTAVFPDHSGMQSHLHSTACCMWVTTPSKILEGCTGRSGCDCKIRLLTRQLYLLGFSFVWWTFDRFAYAPELFLVFSVQTTNADRFLTVRPVLNPFCSLNTKIIETHWCCWHLPPEHRDWNNSHSILWTYYYNV